MGDGDDLARFVINNLTSLRLARSRSDDHVMVSSTVAADHGLSIDPTDYDQHTADVIARHTAKDSAYVINVLRMLALLWCHQCFFIYSAKYGNISYRLRNVLHVTSRTMSLPIPTRIRNYHSRSRPVFTAGCYASAVYAVVVCLSICLSVCLFVRPSATSLYCIKTAKCRIMQPTPYDRLYTVFQKKGDTKLMAVTLSFLNRFSKFFHWHTQR